MEVTDQAKWASDAAATWLNELMLALDDRKAEADAGDLELAALGAKAELEAAGAASSGRMEVDVAAPAAVHRVYSAVEQAAIDLLINGMRDPDDAPCTPTSKPLRSPVHMPIHTPDSGKRQRSASVGCGRGVLSCSWHGYGSVGNHRGQPLAVASRVVWEGRWASWRLCSR